MMQPRFAVGQQVRLLQKVSRVQIDHYVIKQAMPYDGHSYEYRIKSESEKFLRVVKEHELDEERVPFSSG